MSNKKSRHPLKGEEHNIPKAFQVATRRARSRAAEWTVQSLSSETNAQQSRGLKGEGYITQIRVLTDNYVWVLINPENRHCAIVDPGDAKPVLNFLERENLILSAILITHHHWDHVNGVPGIIKKLKVPVYGPKDSDVPCLTNPLEEDDKVELTDLNLTLNVLEIPGHTLDHIAYYGETLLFSGDTLFSAGCGRLFEGTAAQLYQSLCKLAELPDDTQIFCGHEYTTKNLQFALTVEPNNSAAQVRLKECQVLREQNKPTLPSTLSQEKQYNPFLRCREPSVIEAAKKHSAKTSLSPEEVFAVLRDWKDGWG